MSATDSTNEYLLLFRGNTWDNSLSPEELQKTMSSFLSWFERLTTSGVVKAGQPLAEEARIVSGAKGRIVADGPFAESKEAVGGYFLVNAGSFDEAVKIAQGCPMLDHGVIVEVRQIAEQCPTVQRVQQRLARELEPAGV